MRANPLLGPYLYKLWDKGTLQLAMAKSMRGSESNALGYKLKPETQEWKDLSKKFVWDLFFLLLKEANG